MKTGKVLKPGQPGTKKWVEKYGEALVCVRYRNDEKQQQKFTTVEIVVDQRRWKKDSQRIPRNKIMGILVRSDEPRLKKMIESTGGRWDARKQVWKLPYGEIVDLGLERRIVTRD